MRFSNPFMTVRSIKEYEPLQSNRASSQVDRTWPAYAAERKTGPAYGMPMQDKSMLLRPLNDEHLIEVYLEAKAMNLSSEFIQLIEEALRMRNIEAPEISNT